jgi:hypothetical protein
MVPVLFPIRYGTYETNVFKLFFLSQSNESIKTKHVMNIPLMVFEVCVFLILI